MELYLQCGYGMMGHCRDLFAEWGGGTAILSPRDLEHDQMIKLSADVRALNGRTLIDPQFYFPHADHERLTSHSFWPETFDTDTFFDGHHIDMVSALAKVNADVGTRSFIVPGFLAEEIDDAWLATQRAFLEAAQNASTQSLIATAALSTGAVRDADQVQQFVEFAEEVDIKEHYLVLERAQYIVDDPMWLTNMMDLVASLRRQGARVTLGYCNQHGLLAAAAGANAVASGTYLNVRQFTGSKFDAAEEDEIKRKALWYYLPQTLSEFKLPFLDLAYRSGDRGLLVPNPNTSYASALLRGPQPSASGWGETEAHRHYLDALRSQARAASRDTFDETIAVHNALLDGAEGLLATLHARGVRGQQRDFEDALDAHRGALSVFEATHGPALRRDWAKMR